MQIINIGSRIVNTYLVSCDNGYIMIDTGYHNDFSKVIKRLAAENIHPREIKYIFLTHAHDDHAGFLNEMLEITDARVIIHPKAIERLRRGQNSFDGGCSSLLAYLFCQLLGVLGKGQHLFPAIKNEYLKRLITIDSDEYARICSMLQFEAIETPGHTADHISFFSNGILLCGDAAMNNFPSIRRTIIWIEDLDDFKKTWEKIIAIKPSIIYPAHGKPFSVKDLERFLPYLDRIKLRPLNK